MAARMAEVQRELLQTPAVVVIANHCIGLFQLAALHLDQEQPNLPQAQLAIDALGAIVEGLGERLGDDEGPLRDALTSLRLAFVEVAKQTTGCPSEGRHETGGAGLHHRGGDTHRRLRIGKPEGLDRPGHDDIDVGPETAG